MKLTIDQSHLAAAIGYAARSLPARPPAPVLAGVLLDALDDRLRVSAFDYEVSADTNCPATVTENGRALISGRLLSDIVATVRGDVHLELTGSRMLLRAGSARFTLPTLPLEEYPALPEPSATTGTLAGADLAEAVTQVACAVGKDDTLPLLTGIGLRHDNTAGALTLYATDRYRFAVRTLTWKDADLPDGTAVVPTKALLDAAKAVADDTTVDLALPTASSGLFTVRGTGHTNTIRAMEGELPKYEALFPTEFEHQATVEVAALKAAAQRVALVSAKKESPIKLTFTADDTLVLEGGTSDDAQAVDNVDTSLEGGELSIAFNPAFLIDGLTALNTDRVQFQFTTATKPAVLRGHNTDGQALRYLLMPIRLTG
ncbi:DNA polymerase III subunit beta [Streptomyces griseorubiginosus]|uniref:Beta sliding clamp n=1 Tax=Streptomyces griseorubiginosus TaxID=67304 RepID=A0A101RMM4_9ACTN|nr:DNA polymerase III subunit beta [Streptomyces griseorubiginosus]KUN58445.1 DNA polymerase III subunit beta [Streptomyces griseorubiginosus]